MDLLAEVTGSAVRADVLAVIYAKPGRRWVAAEVARLCGRRPQVITRELRRLTELGLLQVAPIDRIRLYRADLADPIVRELASFVAQTRGHVPSIRRALQRIRAPAVAWIATEGQDLIVLTSAPASLIGLQLAGIVPDDLKPHVISVRQWLVRLEKSDVFIRATRRGRKQWVLGSWQELVRRERAQLDSNRTLNAALASWRDELSDEWDADWDPDTAAAAAR